MLTVLETIQEYKIEILLAKETLDPKITPVGAWAAQMELDGMKERMGVKGGLIALLFLKTHSPALKSRGVGA